MRIQNNIMAMNTHRMYTVNNSAVSRSAEKLSSGYRVNRAGDDAAGLAISEKMRAQIRGLNMASKNSQDAVSLVQTAEGALQEVHSMLQRMNELAVQSASGSNDTGVDRAALQQEFQNLQREIDQIAETTTFNDMKIMDGTYAGAKGASATVNLQNLVGTTGELATDIDGSAATVAITFTGADGKDYSITATLDAAADTDAETTNAALDTEATTVTGTYTTVDQLVSAVNEYLGAVAGDAGITASVNGQQISIAANEENDATAATVTPTITVTNGSVTLNEDGDAPADPVEIEAETTDFVAGKSPLTIQVGAEEGQTLDIYIDAMNTAGLGVAEDSVDIATQDSASSAITATRKAINLVSTQRAELGAMQNRLEHKIQNLDNTAENLSAAESRIRDVDMAKEMTEFTKQNILSQAATAMLAQANSAPQGVLSLLQ